MENTVGKGEIARNEQFLLFPQCFQKVCAVDRYKPGFVWERVNLHMYKARKLLFICHKDLCNAKDEHNMKN